MKTLVVKLITGDEVICHCKGIPAEGGVTLENPCLLMQTPQGIGLMPLSPLMKEKKVVIDRNHIIYFGDVEDEIANNYNVQFGGLIKPVSGIQIPN